MPSRCAWNVARLWRCWSPLCRRGQRNGQENCKSKTEKVRMKCDICGKVTDRQSLKSHMKFVHEKKQKWKCDICSKIFYKPGHLKNHFWAIHRKEINHGAAKEYRIEWRKESYLQKIHLKTIHLNFFILMQYILSYRYDFMKQNGW